MTTNEQLQQIQTIFRQVLNQPELKLQPDTPATAVDGWDSLNHLVLMNEIEQHFQVQFRMEESAGFQSVGDILQALQTH